MSMMNKLILFILIAPLCLWGLFLLITKPPSVSEYSPGKGLPVEGTPTESQAVSETRSERAPEGGAEPEKKETSTEEAPTENPATQTTQAQPPSDGISDPLQQSVEIEAPQVDGHTGEVKHNEVLTYRFDQDKKEKLPKGFSSFRTGKGSEGQWVIIQDPSAPSQPQVVAQVSTDKTSSRFLILLLDEKDFQDVEIAVKFKPVSGKTAQAGGIIVRYQDPKNYYVLRADALKNSYAFYQVTKGKPILMASKTLKIAPNQWYTLKLRCKGEQFEGYLNDQLYIKVRDTMFKQGKVGLWTRGDSVVHFDDLSISSLETST